MQDIHSLLAALHRPCLLMRAARIGAQDYRRDGHLLGYGMLPSHADALMRLMDIEAEKERQRKMSDTCYSLVDHVDVLIGILGEARALRAQQTGPQRE
ncbi:MAG: DUF6477 family protein [Sulfitobacter sp.]